VDLPPQPLGVDVLMRIKDSLFGNGDILYINLDEAPTK
jgi:hypothetical protein